MLPHRGLLRLLRLEIAARSDPQARRPASCKGAPTIGAILDHEDVIDTPRPRSVFSDQEQNPGLKVWFGPHATD
jgi:hypothetical protein